ncbi:MAG: Hsp70 family protein, partial [Bradymonadaceae bacterium]
VFNIDENGIVSVSAKDLGTGREQRVNIVADGGLSERDINRMIAEAQANEDQDVLRKELIEKRNQAQGLLFSTERSLNEYGDMLPEEFVAELNGDIATIKELIDEATAEEVDMITATLEAGAYRLAEAMYGAMEAEGMSEAMSEVMESSASESSDE